MSSPPSDPTLFGGGIPQPPPLPERIGSYRILRKIGEGGMGTVYEAEQEKPRRLVALKVLSPGVATPDLLLRFERESHVLGLLQHPGIAQVYEAGTADAGFGPQPYFAMELVHGRRLDYHAHDRNLTVRQRLELVARVCDAVQHAHSKGIVHRDLKPANVLVVPDDDPTSTSGTTSRLETSTRDRDIAHVGQPKVLDFGIARVTDADLQAATIQTKVGEILGTVRYMSPEQVEGDSRQLDARTDIYSLGVVTFELLSGKPPHEADGRSVFEVMRAIREDEPRRLATVHRSFRGDVDTIVAKALEKEKGRRYTTAGEMAADVRRFLHDEPIVARPPSTAYQVRKFAARNRVLVAGVAATFLALVVGIVATAWQAYSAVRARDAASRAAGEARRAESEARAINDFLVKDLLLSADPHTSKGRAITVESVLESAAARVDGAFPGEPLVAASVRATLGRVFYSLGRADDAEPHLRFAFETQRRLLGEESDVTLETMHDLGRTQLARKQLEEAESLLREEHAIFVRLHGSEAAAMRATSLGQVLDTNGDAPGAEAVYTAAIEASKRIEKMDSQQCAVFATASTDLARIVRRRGDWQRAIELYDQAFEVLHGAQGELHPDVARVIALKAELLTDLDRLKDAVVEYERALEIEHKVFRGDHPDIAVTELSLAYTLYRLGDLAEAEAHARTAFEIRTRVFGTDAPESGGARMRLGSILRAADRLDEADPLLRSAVADIQRGHGPDSTELAEAQFELALLLRAKKDYDGALAACTDALRIRRAREQWAPTYVIASQSLLAQLQHAKGAFEPAEAAYREVLESYRTLEGESSANLAVAHANLGMVLEDQGKLEAAEEELSRALEIQRKISEAGSPNVAFLITPTARVMKKLGRLDDAAVLLEEGIGILKARMPAGHTSTASAVLLLGEIHLAQGRAAEAEPLLDEAVEIRRQRLPEGDWQRAAAESALGRCFAALGRHGDAEPLLAGAYDRLAGRKSDPSLARATAQALAELYAATGAEEKAAEWRARAAAPPP